MKLERFTGCLLGLGVGDALGAPIEFMSAEQIRIKHGIVRDMLGGGWLHLRPGETTDDTALALALAGSLLEKGAFDRDDAARRYVAWLASNPPDVGNATRASLSRIAAGMDPYEASAQAHNESGGRTASNGALMRCAPVALAFPRDAAALVDVSLADARITHHDPLAGWSCAAWNVMIAAALGEEKDKARLPALAAATLSARGAPAALPDPSAKREGDLNPTGYALDTLECALWAFLRGKTFEECLVLAVNLGGDADTIGAVCGALAGAWHGAAKIPDRWLRPLDRRQALEEAGRGFFQKAGGTVLDREGDA
jgi:ADP-ribosyl-[dinitrogen reductase] hydrolase